VVSQTDASPTPIDVIQGATSSGSDDPGTGPIKLERTRDTGLVHDTGTISMARDGPDTATSSFFIVVERSQSLDFGGQRNADGQGFAAFGRIIEGMDIVRRIHRSAAIEESLVSPVVINGAEILSGAEACSS